MSGVQLPPYYRESESDVRALALPYHLADREFPRHWLHTDGGRGILVGVADTGIDPHHQEIAGRVYASRSFVGRSSFDGNDHGTHVATTIGGNAVGVAPSCELAIAKVLGDNGAGSNRGVAEGIDWLVAEGCHIINLSLGGPTDDRETREAILRAIAAGVLVIAATGNERASQVGYPARHCVAVGAVDRAMKLAYFSNRGKDVDLVGYGVNVYAGIPRNRYAEFSGTSMATPFIAGCAANRLSAELKHLGKIVTKSADDLLKLETLVTDLGEAGRDTSYGRGFPDLGRALYEQLEPPAPPVVTPPINPSVISEPIEISARGVLTGREFNVVTLFPRGES